MPFYEYLCEGCNNEFVLLQPITANAEDSVCPHCNEKKARRLVSKFSSSTSSDAVCSAEEGGGGG